MKISLITITYPPEIGGAAHLINDLAISLQARGNDVIVFTCFPTYNVKEVPEKYRRGSRMDEVLDGIPVRRIRIPSLSRANKLATLVMRVNSSRGSVILLSLSAGISWR